MYFVYQKFNGQLLCKENKVDRADAVERARRRAEVARSNGVPIPQTFIAVSNLGDEIASFTFDPKTQEVSGGETK